MATDGERNFRSAYYGKFSFKYQNKKLNNSHPGIFNRKSWLPFC